MIDDSITREEFVEMVPRVFNTLEHSSDFLDTLLFWINSQVESTKNTVRSFSISKLVSRELTHLEDQLKQKGISVTTKIAPDALALADPNSIRIVIHNFLTNAIKFSYPNGTIEVISHIYDTEWVLFIVKDHGVGMNEEYLDSLFKNQVASALGTENEAGTGMGLLFCKDLVEKYKGKIWANSKVGVGTELCFVLPVGEELTSI
jgi:signal transduction histidine kinase